MATLGASQAVMPGVAGVLAAGVAVGRWQRPLPVGRRAPLLVAQAACTNTRRIRYRCSAGSLIVW